MQNVVVATDLTPASHTALERAAGASRSMGGALRLVHVLPQPVLPVVGDIRLRKAERALDYSAQRLGHRSGLAVSCNVKHGDTPRGIVRESEDLEAVLTVFGHCCDRAAARRLFGTTPERSLKLIRNAALIVRDRPAGQEGYRRVLLAPAGGVGASALMRYVSHLAPDATVHRLDPAGTAKGRPTAEKVRAMRRALDADLLVLGIPRDETLNPFRFRHLLTELVRMPECDTLFVPQDCDTVPAALPETGRIRIAS